MTDANATVKPPRSRLLLIGLIVGTIAAALAILPVFVMATMSVMVAASGSSPLIFTFLTFAWSLPFVVVVGPVGAWVAYALRRERTAWVLLFWPAVWAAIMFGILFLVPDGVA